MEGDEGWQRWREGDEGWGDEGCGKEAKDLEGVKDVEGVKDRGLKDTEGGAGCVEVCEVCGRGEGCGG